MNIIDTIRQENQEPVEGDFCPCCGDILTKNHQCEEGTPTKPHTATYSPEDDKIRIYPLYRLPKDEYNHLKSAGFMWAPKQECFYAIWTPHRETTALQFADEIEDEDKSLVDRAEERAERFENYSDHRAQDADRAHKAVSDITDNIPFGQPILVGHHSEKHARRDAKRIKQGMTRAVKMWETSTYWTRRAAGALAHAKYKERPEVRARRIKGLEADKRKQERNQAQAETCLKLWNTPGLTPETALIMAGRTEAGRLTCHREDTNWYHAYDVLQPDGERWTRCPSMTLEQVQTIARRSYPETIAHCQVWIDHINNRLLYEKAMLDEQGASDLLKPAPRPEQLPLCNYRAAEGFIMIPNRYNRGELENYRQVDMTKAEYAKIYTDYKGTHVIENSHRVRTTMLRAPTFERVTVFITDSKEHKKPEAIEKKEINPDLIRRAIAPTYQEKEVDPQAAKFDAMKESLKTGVQTVTAPQLFPTPPEICAQMIEHAEIEPEQSILEPSAGTGNIIKAILAESTDVHLDCVEINYDLCQILKNYLEPSNVYHGDFLETSAPFCPDTEKGYDRIIMNPPFENGSDIKHIRHAMTFLKPGGRLVALCANGPRQQEAFRETAEWWEPLPAKSFASQGTNVNVAMLVLTKPTEGKKPGDPETKPEKFSNSGQFSTETDEGDPETRLRAMWEAQGVPQERQEEIIRDTTVKAQPGAYVGPFRIPERITPRLTQMMLF
jgi:phospholipid N-methyltransferase